MRPHETGYRYHYDAEDGRPLEADAVCPTCGFAREDHEPGGWLACWQLRRVAS